MIDTATIRVKAGNGGDGLASFRRLKYVPKGGPWGGDGGKGGDIIFKVDPHLNTLTPFRRQRVYKAEKGLPGMKDNKHGRDGEDLYIKIAPGTLVKNEEGEVLYDLTEIGQEQVIEKGGKGGLGNVHFKSSTNRTPMKATPGEVKEEIVLNLELKLLADVGIIGLPSSGKSTLLNSLTSTNVKTADYHFTTLEPNLGVLHINQYIPQYEKDFVLADIPGLIEGASEGKGLGHEFLRHIERTRILVHVVDGAKLLNYPVEQLLEDYLIIQDELSDWNESLLNKSQILVINKIDLNEVKDKVDEISTLFNEYNKEHSSFIEPIQFVSAATSENLNDLVVHLSKVYEESKPADPQFDPDEPKTMDKRFTIDNLPNKRIVFN